MEYAFTNRITSQNSDQPKIIHCIETDELFPSAYEAALWIIEQSNIPTNEMDEHIAETCNLIISASTGKRESAYKYHWELI